MKTLNHFQKKAIWLGIAMVVAGGIWLPWKANGEPLPYAFIFNPPKVEKAEVHIDFERLAVQWLMAAVLTAGLIVTTDKGNAGQNSKSAAGANQGPVTGQAGEKAQIVLPTAPAAAAAKTTPAAEKPLPAKLAQRLLKFSENRSLGEILIESADDPDYWESFAPAKGTVQLPIGRHVQFELSKDAAAGLDLLGDLPADAFYSMDLSASRISDADLKTIQHFSDLSELDLSDTSVTDEGIKHLLALTKLKKLWLDNTAITEEGLENLKNLGQLTKVSLIGVKVTEPAAQTLKNKFANCEIVLQESQA